MLYHQIEHKYFFFLDFSSFILVYHYFFFQNPASSLVSINTRQNFSVVSRQHFDIAALALFSCDFFYFSYWCHQ